MWQIKDKWDELDVLVKVVTFDANFMALAYVERTKMTWPLLLDSDQSLYQAYGMHSGSWWSLYGLPSVVRYLRLMAKGKFPGKPGRDWRQLGGNVLIDPKGMVRMHHVSESPHDRPSIKSLLAAVQQS